MKIAIVNLLMRTVKSESLLPQMDKRLPRWKVRAESPMVVLVADGMARQGHDVTVFAGSMFDIVRDCQQGKRPTAEIVSVKERLQWLFPPSYYPFAPTIAPQLEKGGYDVVLTTDIVQPCTQLARLAVSGEQRVFIWQELAAHPRFPICLASKGIFLQLRAMKSGSIKELIPRSEKARAFLESQGVPNSMLSRTIPNAVDCDTFAPNQYEDFFASRGIEDVPRPRIVIVARTDRAKGIDTFMAASRIALNRGFPGSFIVKVTGPSSSSIRETANTLGISGKVKIIDEYLPRKDLAMLMASCDLCAAPSAGDLLFFVPLESIASGVPVITTTQTHHTTTFADGRAGLIIPPNDVNRLADAFIELTSDEDRLRRMSKAAREIALTEFSTESVSRRLLSEFSKGMVSITK